MSFSIIYNNLAHGHEKGSVIIGTNEHMNEYIYTTSILVPSYEYVW